MSNLMTFGDASNCTWTDLAMPTVGGVNCAKHSIFTNSKDRGLDEEEVILFKLKKPIDQYRAIL